MYSVGVTVGLSLAAFFGAIICWRTLKGALQCFIGSILLAATIAIIIWYEVQYNPGSSSSEFVVIVQELASRAKEHVHA